MANVNHSTLTDPYLHEPKGIASANAGEVYVANGSGSGSWDPQHHIIGAYLPFDATTPAYSHSATTSLSVINPTLTTSVTDGFTATNTPNARVIYSNGVDINSQIIRSEEHTSELQSRLHLVCRLLLEKKKRV